MARKRKLHDQEDDDDSKNQKEEEVENQKNKKKKAKLNRSVVVLLGPGFTSRRKEMLERDAKSHFSDLTFTQVVEIDNAKVIPDEVTHIVCGASYPKNIILDHLEVSSIPSHVKVVRSDWLEKCKKNDDLSCPEDFFLCFYDDQLPGEKKKVQSNNSPKKTTQVEHVATPRPPLRRQLTSESDRENIRLDEKMENLDEIENENEEKTSLNEDNENEVKDEIDDDKREKYDETNKNEINRESKDDENTSTRKSPSLQWELLGKGAVLYGCYEDVQPSSKFIGFDIDGTIIRTSSGKRFAESVDDWELFHPCVVDRLKESIQDGYKIIFITNQLGVEKGNVSIASLKQKFGKILKRIDLPIQLFASLQDDIYRKPRTKMFDLIQRLNGGLQFDREQCKYVGDAAGRPKTNTTPRDHSASDYLFALNLGIQFETPERFFLQSKLALHTSPSSWELGFNPKTEIPQLSEEERQRIIDSFAPVPDEKQELVIVVGSPASGKSSLSRNYFPNYERVNQDTLKNISKCLKVAGEKLSQGKSVIVDNTNRDTGTRGQWIELARAKKVPIRCIWLDIPKDLSFHLNTFRSIQKPSSSEDKTDDDERGRKVSSAVIHTFYKNYQEPKEREGFDRVTKIGFIPGPFASDEHRELFYMYLA